QPDVLLEERLPRRVAALAVHAEVELRGALEERERLDRRGGAARLLAGAEEIVFRLRQVLGAPEVVREHAVEVLQAVAERRLDRLRAELVGPAPHLQEERLVDRLLRERVAEDVLELADERPAVALDRPAGFALEEDVAVAELGELALAVGVELRVSPEHLAHDAEEEAPADDRRNLQHLPSRRIEAIDARHDDFLDRARHLDAAAILGDRAAAGVAPDRAGFDQREEHLFDVEWVALGAAHDHRPERGRQRVGAEEPADERERLLLAERLEPDLDRVRAERLGREP